MQPTAIKRLQNILQGNGTKIKRETIKKQYFYDNGILNLFLFQPETKLLENLVAIQLYKKYGENLYYFNKNVEVDFCVPQEGLLIQVSYRMVDDATRSREVGALQKVSKFLNAKQCLIITYDKEETIHSDELKGDIKVIPIYKFLLEDLEDIELS